MARKIEIEIVGDASKLKRSLREGETAMGKMSSGFGSLAKKAALAGGAAGLGAIVFGAKKAVDATKNLNESVNAVNVVFGTAAKQVLNFSENAAKKAGLSMREFNESVTPIGASLRNAGYSADAAAKASINLTKRAADMASVFNTSVADSLQAIQAGLRGEADPLERFGVNLSEAAVNAKAQEMGLIGATKAVKSYGESTMSTEAAQKKLTAAQKAQEGASKAVQAAQEKEAASQEKLRDAQEGLRDSTDKVKDAKDRLREAQDKGKEAQLALTDARKRAADQLQELKERAEDSVLSEESASIRLEKARINLEKVTGDAESTELDRREALLEVRQAEDDLQDAQRDRQKLEKDLEDGNKKGVEGAKDVVDAKKKVKDAHKEEALAARQVREAQEDMRESQEKIVAAQAGIIKAHQDVADAEKRVAETADAVTKAQDDLSAAQSRGAAAATEVVDKLTPQEKQQARIALLMEQTNKVSGDFEKTSGSLANMQRTLGAELENTAARLGQKLIPKVEQFVAFVKANLPTIEKIIQDLFNWIDQNVIPIAIQVKNVWVAAITAFRKVLDENGPELKNILTGIATVMKTIAEVVGPALEFYFTKVWPPMIKAAITVLSGFVTAIEKIVDGFKWIGEKAGPMITKMWDVAKKPFENLADDLRSIARFFDRIKNAAEWLIQNVGKLGKAFELIPGVGGGGDAPFDTGRGGGGNFPTPPSKPVQGDSHFTTKIWDELDIARRVYGLALGPDSWGRSYGDHGKTPSHAIDMSGGLGAMSAFANAMYGRPGSKDVIYGYHPFWQDNGRMISWAGFEDLREQHKDHVHYSVFDQGGWLQPGWTLAYNGTGMPERVGGAGNVYVTVNAPNYVGSQRELADAVQVAAKQFQRDNGRSLV